MRYATFSISTEKIARPGVVFEDRIVELRALFGEDGEAPGSILDLIDAGPDTWRRAAELAAAAPRKDATSYALADVRLHAPIPTPRKNIVCLGLNYASHMEEAARARSHPAQEHRLPGFE